MKKSLRRIFWGIGTIALVGGGIVVYSAANKPVPEYSSTMITRSEFIQSVEETGVIDTQVSITYGWETSGRVIEVSKDVGDMVTSSDIIAKLDNRDEVNSLRQAQAQLAAARARLNEMLSEPSEEDQDTYRARIAQAEANLAQSQTNLEKTRTTVAADIATAARAVDTARANLQETDTISQAVQDAYDDLVNVLDATVPDLRDALTEADNILGVDNTFANDDYDDVLGVQGMSMLNAAEGQYLSAKESVSDVEDVIGALTITTDFDTIDSATSAATEALNTVNTLLQLVLDVLDATPPIGSLTQTELEALQSGIITKKINITSARTTLTNTRQAVTSAKNTTDTKQISLDEAIADLERANRVGDQQIASAERTVEQRQAALQESEAAYAAFVAGPRDVDVAALRADVSRYSAAVEAAQTAVDDMVLRALADGTITMLDVSVGETVNPNQNIVTIQSNDRKIEVDISESDIAKISVGDEAMVELDAYDDVTLTARVTKVDPAATEISGVVYYKTTLEIDVPEDLDIRPGMTADVQIITERKENTIALPRRAILTSGGSQVRILTNAETADYELRTVTVGITGDDGLVEITSGVGEGDEVITFIEE